MTHDIDYRGTSFRKPFADFEEDMSRSARPDFVELKEEYVGSVFVRRSEVACFNRHANSGAVLVHLKCGVSYTLVSDITMEQLTDPESELCLIQ